MVSFANQRAREEEYQREKKEDGAAKIRQNLDLKEGIEKVEAKIQRKEKQRLQARKNASEKARREMTKPNPAPNKFSTPYRS